MKSLMESHLYLFQIQSVMEPVRLSNLFLKAVFK